MRPTGRRRGRRGLPLDKAWPAVLDDESGGRRHLPAGAIDDIDDPIGRLTPIRAQIADDVAALAAVKLDRCILAHDHGVIGRLCLAVSPR